ncbi:MAG: pitrilysin family protein [Candidatus Woesebacteria bacterium]|jgi:predicted Zn-dependent peptidase
MKYKKSKLKNGLRIITSPMPTLESATVTFWVGVGSRFESKGVRGLSHFLEHIVFKGTKKRPTARVIAAEIDSFGGVFNASTSKEWTNFYIKARSGVLKIAFDVLSDMVLNPLLRKEDIEREKGVILEEIAMKDDTPISKIGDVFEQVIFSGNSLGEDIIGTKETVKRIERDDFVDLRSKHYNPNNILVTVAGGIDEKEIDNLVEKYFGDLKGNDKLKPKNISHKQEKPRVFLEKNDGNQAHFILGFLGNPMGHKERYAEAVLSALLGSGMSSRMFTEVREKRGLAYAVRTSMDRYTDCGYMGTYVGADVKRVDEAVKVVLDQHYGLAKGKYPIGEEELKKAKEYLKGHLALSLEDTRSVNDFIGVREILLNKVETVESVYKGIDKVTKKQVMNVAKKFFIPKRLNFAVIGPFKNRSRFDKILTNN